MKNINVLILTTDSRIGGTEKILIEFLKKADRTKFNIFFMCLKPGGPLADIVKKMGFKSECLNVKNIFGAIRAYFYLKRFLKQNKIQILHSYLFHSNILSRIIRIHTKIPLIINSQRSTDEWKKWYHIFLDRYTGFLCDAIICNSLAVYNTMLGREKHKKEKLLYIPSGIDIKQYEFKGIGIDIRDSIGIPHNVPLLINVGNLRKPKGQIFLLKAMKIIKDRGLVSPKPKAIIVGEGALRGFLEKGIRNLKIEKDVFLLGFRDDIVHLLGASDIFVLSSLWEGLPVSVMEAMALKKPIIATNVGGILELIQDNKTGLLVPSANPVALADAIERLLNNPQMIPEMGRNAKEFIEKNYTIEKMVDSIESLYIDFLEERKRNKLSSFDYDSPEL